MKRLVSNILLVMRFNNILFFRNPSGKKHIKFHGYFVIILVLLSYSAFTWIFISELANEEPRYLASAMIFVIATVFLIIETFVLATRYTDFNRCVIPRNLLLLQLPLKKLYFLILWDLLFNVNMLGFIGSSIIILYYVPGTSIAARAFSLAPVIVYAVLVGIWVENAYIVTAKAFIKYKHYVAIAPLSLLMLWQLAIRSVDEDTVWGATKAISGSLFAIIGSWGKPFISTGVLLLILVLGIITGLFLIRRFRHNFVG